MNENKKAVLPDETAQVESLLWAARSYQPDGAAPPEGLAALALTWHRIRAEARRRAGRRALTRGGGMAAVTASVIGVFFWQRMETAKVSPQMAQIAQAAPEPLRAPVKTPIPSRQWPSTQPMKPATALSAPAPRPVAAVPTRSNRRLRRTLTPRRPAAARFPQRERVKRQRHIPRRRAPRVPEAQWVVHTVRRDTYGVLAPAWIAQADEASGEVEMTPVVVDIPVHTEERIIAAAHTDDGDGVFDIPDND